MNYRILFFISILILAIGVGGLFMMPTGQSEAVSPTDSTASPAQKEPKKKNIKVAVARQSLSAGSILKEGDYQVSDMQVEEESVLMKDDVSDALVQNNDSLNGLVISEPVLDGRFVPSQALIAPTDERFLFYTVDKDEVIYRVYIRNENQFALDTLRSGDIVGLYALQKDLASGYSDEQRRFDPVLQNLEVVKINRFVKDDKNSALPEFNDYAGYVSVRMKADQVKNVLSLTKSRSLLVLPQAETSTQPLNQRGLTIRSLRGKGN